MKFIGELARILVGPKADVSLNKTGALIKANAALRGQVAKLQIRNEALEMIVDELDGEQAHAGKAEANWTHVLR